MLNLDGVFLLEPIVDERRPRVIGATVVDILIRQWQIFQHRGSNGIDAVWKNPVSGKRISHNYPIDGSAGQRIVDGHWTALSVGQSRKVTRTFSRCRKYHADVSRLHVVIILSSEPKERPVLDNRTAETTTKEIIGIVRFRNTSLLAEEVVLLAPNGTRLKETRAVKLVGSRF